VAGDLRSRQEYELGERNRVAQCPFLTAMRVAHRFVADRNAVRGRWFEDRIASARRDFFRCFPNPCRCSATMVEAIKFTVIGAPCRSEEPDHRHHTCCPRAATGHAAAAERSQQCTPGCSLQLSAAWPTAA